MYFRNATPKALSVLSFQGSCTGLADSYQTYCIPKSEGLPDGDMIVSSADLNGTGLGGWLMYTLTNDQFTVCPMYSGGAITDFLSPARDSMGMLSRITYAPMSDPAVDRSSVAWDDYAPSRHSRTTP